jgi:hypothetical protein
MNTILVVNAGSSSVKFQVFDVQGEGRLQRQIKGQMDGIGSRPRLRATGSDGGPLADRAYPIEAVADVPAADTGTVARVVPPSLKVTVPAGAPNPVAPGVTVAVSVTWSP